MKNSAIFITGGKFKRARLATPSAGTHPMGSRERLALFNILDCSGRQVLDLFAGSGALGFEALSRAAKTVTFVEKSPAACQIIRENAAKLDVSASVIIKALKAEDPLTAQDLGTYDIVFVDPPYDHPEFFTTENINTYANFVKSGATLVLSRPKNSKITPPDTLKLQKTREYAALALDFFNKV